MQQYAEKQESNKQAVAHSNTKQAGGGQGSYPLTDNRPQSVIQRKIKVGENEFSAQDDNLDELVRELKVDPAFARQQLQQKGISFEQVLTRFDFQNRKFDNTTELVIAVRKELTDELGGPDPEIDKTVPIHPLEKDNPLLESKVLDALKRLDSTGNLRNLILEDTEAAKAVMNKYREFSEHPVSDTILFKSILATIELHQSGATHHSIRTEEEDKLFEYVHAAYSNADEMMADYKIDQYEHKSICAYSDANKDKIFIHGAWNNFYMGYSFTNWGHYKDGWTALASALKKLPSLAQLRLKVTAYRSSRNSKETGEFEKLQANAPVLHGKNVLGQEQQHYTSTALTYNSHMDPQRINKAKSLMAITGSSGVFINPFGIQGFTDGAEILFPPNMVTRLVEKRLAAFNWNSVSVPVYHLHEDPLASKDAPENVDDFTFKKTDPGKEGLQRRWEKMNALVDQIQRFKMILTGGEKIEFGNKIPDESQFNKMKDNPARDDNEKMDRLNSRLTALKEELFVDIEKRHKDPAIIENHDRLLIINKLNALPFEKKVYLNVYTMGKTLWQHSLKELEALERKLEER
ncbi:MAG: hypothetical protein WCF67_20145 [Chitinophagaceae bacterium]